MDYSTRVRLNKAAASKYVGAEMAALDMVKSRWDAVPWRDDMAELQEAINRVRPDRDECKKRLYVVMADLEMFKGLATVASGIDRITTSVDVNQTAIKFEAAIMRLEAVAREYEQKVDRIVEED